MAFKMSGFTPFSRIKTEVELREEAALENLKLNKKDSLETAINRDEKKAIRKKYRSRKKNIKDGF